MNSQQRPVVSQEALSSWCVTRFGSPLSDIIFESGYSSAVFGIVLRNERRIVIKVRSWHERLVSCWGVHRQMWEAGFPCPEPLSHPERHEQLAISFESYLPGGEQLPRGIGAAEELGRVLAELVKLAPPTRAFPNLYPAWGFLRWDDPGDTWPLATDIAADLSMQHDPAWIEYAASLVRPIIRGSKLPAVIGHGDWWTDNIRWDRGNLLSVDDWDSIVALSEPAIAGVAAALFASGQSTIEGSAMFLDAYITASDRRWNTLEYQHAWAAGLWARLFDARKATMLGIYEFATQLGGEVEERLDRAGVKMCLSGL
jgi:Ser/Thr protein kinase RdoA (MazF antagonist)